MRAGLRSLWSRIAEATELVSLKALLRLVPHLPKRASARLANHLLGGPEESEFVDGMLI